MEWTDYRALEKKNRKKQTKGKKKKIIIVSVIAAVVIFSILTVIFVLANRDDGKDKVIIDGKNELKNVTGRLKTYIEDLGDNYYIRYLGQFGKRGLNNELVEGTVEFTRKGPETGTLFKEINFHVVTDSKYAYNIIHNYDMVVRVELPVDFNIKEYNLISDFGQRYIADVSTTVLDVNYIYQEYEYNDCKLRYYFIGDELRYIRVITGESDRKINIRIDRHTKQDLLEVPKEYNWQDA